MCFDHLGGGGYVEGNAEGFVGGNAEGNAKCNAKGNAEGNAGGLFSLTMVSGVPGGYKTDVQNYCQHEIYNYLTKKDMFATGNDYNDSP